MVQALNQKLRLVPDKARRITDFLHIRRRRLRLILQGESLSVGKMLGC